jgi:tetratricopeptide (TPR) repeat protein
MPNRSADTLFQLIQSLERSEKRNFKLYITRNTGSADLKIVQLFDALEAMKQYDEELLLKKNPSLQKQQLSNLKAHLYREILASLRLLKHDDNIDLQIHEQLDFARILYNKGLYLQSLKVLEKVKEFTKSNNQATYLQQILFLEKKIEALHITRSLQNRAEELSSEVDEVNRRVQLIGDLSNLSLQLYSWYIKNGHARNDEDRKNIEILLSHPAIEAAQTEKGFYERLYLYQCYCWHAFITQQFLSYYRYCQKWVDLFHSDEKMITIETASYIKGLHNLLGAHFDLRNYQKFNEVMQQMEEFIGTPIVQHNKNNQLQTFIYLYTSRINSHFMMGTFTEGLHLVPYIEEKLKEYELFLDRHRVLVFYYKFASLYFGSGLYEQSIDYLNKIIQLKVDLRTDLQCYARLLHLIAHYELGNYDLLQYLLKSVYRFMYKMKNLSIVEEKIFAFLRQALRLTPKQIKPLFASLLTELKPLEKSNTGNRAFMYLDIISWLESKLSDEPVQQVIRKKYLTAIKESRHPA